MFQTDFVTQTVELSVKANFEEMALLQKIIQERAVEVATYGETGNRAQELESLEDLAKTFGVKVDTSLEALSKDGES